MKKRDFGVLNKEIKLDRLSYITKHLRLLREIFDLNFSDNNLNIMSMFILLNIRDDCSFIKEHKNEVKKKFNISSSRVSQIIGKFKDAGFIDKNFNISDALFPSDNKQEYKISLRDNGE